MLLLLLLLMLSLLLMGLSLLMLLLLLLLSLWLLYPVTFMTLEPMLLAELTVHLLEVQSLFCIAHLLQQPVLNINGLVRDLEGLLTVHLGELLQVSLGELLEVSLWSTIVLLHSHLEPLIRLVRGAERDLINLLTV